MPKIKFGEFSPEQLKQARQQKYEEAAQERAEHREETLEKRMQEYLEPFEDIKSKLDELQKKYSEQVSTEEVEALANSILEIAEKEGKQKPELKIIAEAFNKKNFYKFMREKYGIERALEESKQELQQTITKAKADSELFEATSFWDKVDGWRQFNQKMAETLEQELPNKNPESFMAHWLLKLREYKKELKTGIVETESVQQRKQEAIDKLQRHGLIALVGETGTGKTKLATKIADELTGGYEFVMGHEKITKEDMLYYLGIEPQTIKAEDAPKLIEQAQKRYEQLNPDLLPEQRKEKLKWIEQVILGQAQEKVLQTKVVLGPIIKAAQEGKIVIIDEFNFIPPEASAMLNTFIEAKPGEIINIIGKEIEVKKGFGVILTGNISKSQVSRYLKRQELDPAFVNRLNSGLIEYSTLPQEYDKVLQESIIEQAELKKGEAPANRELFAIGLSHLIDTKGNLNASKDALDKLWRLSQEFSILQKIFAGEPLREETATSALGTRFNLQKYHASMRTFGAILDQWKKDSFKNSLDWYLYDNLVRPSSIIAPSESAQIFYLLKNHGQFFQGEEWKNLDVDSRTWKLSGLEKISSKSKADFRQDVELKYFSPQQISEAVSGVKMPEVEMVTQLEDKKIAEQKERMETYKKLEKEIREAEKMLEGWKESIDLFCQDEAAIMGKAT